MQLKHHNGEKGGGGKGKQTPERSARAGIGDLLAAKSGRKRPGAKGEGACTCT